MAEYKLKHTGAVIDQQIDRVIDGSVVVENTLTTLDETSNKPVSGGAVANATNSIVKEGSRLVDTVFRRTAKDFKRGVGSINSGGKWAGGKSYQHILIPVSSGDVVLLRHSFIYYFYFLSDYANPISGQFVQHTVGSLQAYSSVNKTTKYTVPEGAKYMVIQVVQDGVEAFPSLLFLNGHNLLKSVQDYLEDIGIEIMEYVVDVNGGGDFTNLREAVEFCKSLKLNTLAKKNEVQYLLKLKPGIYDIRSYYTEAEWNVDGFVGLTLPRNCKLLGLGRKRDDVIITCTSETKKTLISTLNIEDDVAMENITIYGNNIRYVIHDDASYYPYANIYRSIRRMKNVDFIGEKLTYNQVYGSGTKGGARWEFENCIFLNKSKGIAFSIHDRNGYIDNALAENVNFKRCKFYGSSDNVIRLSPLISQCEENISFEGCVFGSIYIEMSSATTNHYNVSGYGNSRGYKVSYSVDNEIARKSAPNFADEVVVTND